MRLTSVVKFTLNDLNLHTTVQIDCEQSSFFPQTTRGKAKLCKLEKRPRRPGRGFLVRSINRALRGRALRSIYIARYRS